jgi:tetratricopeptide (TPR) repeat protein
MFIIPILIVLIILTAIAFFASLYILRDKKTNHRKIKKDHDMAAAVREAGRRLAKNPRDAGALMFVGDQHFQNGEWEKALQTYEILSDITTAGSNIDMAFVNMRAAICAVNMKMIDAAFKYIAVAHSLGPGNFEIAYQMGNIEFMRKNYEKAVKYLQQSCSLNPGYTPALRMLGHAYFKLKRITDATSYIRKAIELAPDDKESLFTLAECYFESGQKEQAQRVYSHLRPDPVCGAEACLRCGIINIEYHQHEQAVTDFEIGLKHKNIKPDTAIELHYRLGITYLNQKRIPEALEHLKIVQSAVQNYKDTDALVAKYAVMNANKNLQTYVMSPGAEFIALCRKIVLSYFQKAKVKIIKTNLNGNDWADITAEVDTSKWSDTVMFRFIRTQGAIGELVLRDFHSHIKDIKAGKGICLSTGSFSDEARRFTAARLIDLIEKEQFLSILKSIDPAPVPASPVSGKK